MNHSKNVFPPVEKTLHLPLSVEDAFKLFTQGLSTWWPLETHSIGEDQAVSCHIEEHEGGRIYQTNRDGSQSPWGLVLAWEPPNRMVMSWHPGKDVNLATQVEVRFTAEGQGSRLELVHSGWEVLGENAKKTRAGYNSGWDMVLGRYISRTENSPA